MKINELPKKTIKEDIGEDAHNMERNHEIQMARADCYFAAKSAIGLHQMLENMADEQVIEPWLVEKITLAADSLRTAKEHLEYSIVSHQVEPQIGTPDEAALSMMGEDATGGATSSGAVAAVSKPLFKKTIKRVPVKAKK